MAMGLIGDKSTLVQGNALAPSGNKPLPEQMLTKIYLAIANGPLTRYVKLSAAHAPGMLGTFSPPPRVGDPGMHHGTCVTHVPWCMPGSLSSGFLWSRWWGKRSRHSRRMRNPQLYVSGKRPMASLCSVRPDQNGNILQTTFGECIF